MIFFLFAPLYFFQKLDFFSNSPLTTGALYQIIVSILCKRIFFREQKTEKNVISPCVPLSLKKIEKEQVFSHQKRNKPVVNNEKGTISCIILGFLDEKKIKQILGISKL